MTETTPQIISTELEDEFCHAIHTRTTEAPYFNVRNIVRMIAAAGRNAPTRIAEAAVITPPDITHVYRAPHGSEAISLCIAASMREFKKAGVEHARATLSGDGATLTVEGWLAWPGLALPPL